MVVEGMEVPVTTAPAVEDPTLDELRLILAPSVADGAIFDGWGMEAVSMAADMEGIDPDIARLAFKGGAMDMIGAWIETVDAGMAAAFPPETIHSMKVRARIRALVAFRLNALAGRDEALRRAMAIMAMPQNAVRSLGIGWRSADIMWRLAGDTSTDYNHYTKRVTLLGVYGSTLAVFVDDESEGKRDTAGFLDRRIDDVMRFEKIKARVVGSDRDRFSVTRFLGRLRYPER